MDPTSPRRTPSSGASPGPSHDDTPSDEPSNDGSSGDEPSGREPSGREPSGGEPLGHESSGEDVPEGADRSAGGDASPPEPVVTQVPRTPSSNGTPSAQASKGKDRVWLHVLLFLLTVGSTVYVGGVFTGRVELYESQGYVWLLWDGFKYSFALLGALTVHEFGHYFAARHHRINTSLPYYIPLPVMPIGTLGAVIRIREPIPSQRKLFDVGASGPLAGFVIALGALLYALATLPPPEYLLDLGGHEALKEYIRQYGAFPSEMPESEGGEVIVLGETLLYWILTQFFADVPPMYEMYHYPVLYAGWLGLFFTALNLLPVGQLDGGHILYALFGKKWHRRLARTFVLVLLVSGSIGFLDTARPALYDYAEWLGRGSYVILAGILFVYLYRTFDGDHRFIAPSLMGILLVAGGAETIGIPVEDVGYAGWLVWTALIVFLVRVDHPPVASHEPLTPTRRWLGYLSILIFFLCFSLRPIYIV